MSVGEWHNFWKYQVENTKKQFIFTKKTENTRNASFKLQKTVEQIKVFNRRGTLTTFHTLHTGKLQFIHRSRTNSRIKNIQKQEFLVDTEYRNFMLHKRPHKVHFFHKAVLNDGFQRGLADGVLR